MKQQVAAGKPFFLYLPFSMGHAPNYPSKQFAGKSRIGNYGDKMMEGDYHVGQVLDALKELKIDDNTIVVFAPTTGRRAGYCGSSAIWDPPTWATRDPSAANWARRPKVRSAPSASSAGPGTSRRTPPLTPCFRIWISCRPSRRSSAPTADGSPD